MQKKANFYMLLATLFFSCMHALVKDLQQIPIYQLIFFRAIISFILCLVMIQKKRISPFGNNKQLLVLRGVCGVLSLSGFYYSLHHIPLASTITVTNLRPVIILFLGALFLNERVNPIVWIFFLISFAGVIVMGGFDARITNFEMTLLLAATVISCFSAIAVRKLKDSDDPLVVVFYFSLITLPVCVPLAINSWVHPASWMVWAKLISVGLLTHFAQYFMTRGFHLSQFKNMASFSYLGLVFAFALGYFLFDETYSSYSYAGMGLILLGLIGSFLFKDQKKARNSV